MRVAYGLALYAVGSGPFAILANHLSTGGIVSTNSERLVHYDVHNDAPDFSAQGTPTGALTVAILNFGVALDALQTIMSFKDIWHQVGTDYSAGLNAKTLSFTGGTVQFANNTCQLMTRLSRVRGFCSVGILTLDHLLFTDNQLWVNAPETTLALDAALIGMSVQAVSNRLQESLSAVIDSGLSFGLANVTAHNISTYCFLSLALKAQWWVPLPNVVLDFGNCPVVFRTG